MKKIQRISAFIVLLCASALASAGSLSDAYENIILDELLRGVAFSETSPANLYASLHTSTSTDSTPGTEVSGGSYARVAISRATASWKGSHGSATGNSSGTNGTGSNAAAITFPAPTANWGSVTGFCLYDASTSGNAVVCANLTTAKTVNNGDAAPSFAIDALTVQVDN